MRAVVISYRARQFWNALSAVPAPDELGLAQEVLNPDQWALFRQLQPSEQAHSLAVMKRLSAQRLQWDGLTELNRKDLLAAALLHDVGKSLHPLRVWEKVLVVFGAWLSPVQMSQWGAGSPHSWRRAFVVARQHSDWGAVLAAQAGCSSMTVELIRRHQDEAEMPPSSILDYLLLQLQAADDNY